MGIDLSERTPHPVGEQPEVEEWSAVADTFAGRVHIEWDTTAPVTPLGQLPFFIEYLKQGGLFDGWVADCPLLFTSPNAPRKRDVLGTLLLSVLAGHRRYAHVTALRCDAVNPPLLGMSKVVSEDALRRALAKIDEGAGVQWLQGHLDYCVRPLLDEPWVLDVDATIKPLYGHQSLPRRRPGKAQWSAIIRANQGGPRIAITPICYRICDWFCGLRCIPAITTIPRMRPPGCGRCWRSSGASAGRACCAVMPNGATKG
jgi:hypothetical protein